MMPGGVRRRLDAEIVRRGLAASRTEAQEAVRAGLVTVGGRPATKTSMLVEGAEPIRIQDRVRRYVSRGGEKLAAGLESFAFDPTGMHCLDAGASTGGFTDCLLQAGAATVTSVDVGYGQLAWTLRNDPRVTVIERTNIRELAVGDLAGPVDLVVADLSFISLAAVVPKLASLTARQGAMILLVKPQFESSRSEVGKGGVVREPAVWRAAVERVAAACDSVGFEPRAVIPSPLPGPAGNVEFLLLAGGEQAVSRAFDVDAAVVDGKELR